MPMIPDVIKWTRRVSSFSPYRFEEWLTALVVLNMSNSIADKI
jgi:hypothetical protein